MESKKCGKDEDAQVDVCDDGDDEGGSIRVCVCLSERQLN